MPSIENNILPKIINNQLANYSSKFPENHYQNLKLAFFQKLYLKPKSSK